MLLALLSLCHAATIEVYAGEDLFAALDAVQPGDEVIVHSGTWSAQQPGGSWFRSYDWQGTANDPIVVRVAPGEVAVIEGDPAGSQNVLNLQGQHFTFAGFELVYGSHGLRMNSSAHVVLEDLHIHDTGDVGLSMNIGGAVYEDVTIRGTHIHHTNGTGECMYLGCNDDACQVFDSLIEWNWCHDTLAASQGDGIELKTGSYNTIVRHNVIHDVKYPGITMYGAKGRGNNQVYGNVVWNSGDNGIQVVGEVSVFNNVVVNSGNNGIQVKASQGEVPQDLWIAHNTVDGAGDACFRGNDLGPGSTGTVANNAFHCPGANGTRLPLGAGALVFASNGVAGVDEAGGGLPVALADFADPAGLDYHPAAGSALEDAADPAFEESEDFNCLQRSGAPDLGAYEVTGPANPGWVPVADFKQCAAAGTGTTGTASGTATGSGTAGTGTGAGTGGGAGTGAGTGGATGTGTGKDTGGSVHEGKGCGCSATGGPGAGWWVLAAAGLGWRRRVGAR